MGESVRGCPARGELAAYLDEALPAGGGERVAAHIDGCPDCQSALDALTGGSGPRPAAPGGIGATADLASAATLAPSGGPAPGAPGSGGPETRVLGGRPVFAPPQLAVPPAIPGYDVQAEIGRGGMGVVYRALHKRLNRPAAIKMVLAGGVADPRTTQRFLFEAEVLARVTHPQVVKVFEVSMYQAPTGVSVPYLVMELLDGGTLYDLVRGQRRPALESAGLVEGLARAAHAAHAQGIVHRDIKPANVLRAASGEFKLGDFGLAKLVAAHSENLTGTGTVLGTPSYMAPEQAGGGGEVGPAADIYSLGAVLYELLAGKPPFGGGEPMSILLRVLNESPPEVRALAPEVPRDLAAVAMKCLSKRPRDRYATAEALADDLRRVIEGRPTRARPLRRREKATLWARRNPAVAGLLAALSLAIAGGLAGTAREYLRAEERADAATESSRRAEDNARAAREGRAGADRAGARLAFDQGVALCEQGRLDGGMGLLLDSLEAAERVGDAPLARAARVNLRNWAESLFPPGRRVEFAAGAECYGAAYSPDGKYLALCGRSQTVRVLDADTLAPVATLRLHESVADMAVNCYRLAAAAALPPGGDFARWGRDLAAATVRALEPLYGKWINDICFDSTGRYVVAGQHDERLTAWDWRAGRAAARYRPQRALDTGGNSVYAVAPAPGGAVWFGDGAGRVRRFDPAAGKVTLTLAASGSLGGAALKRAGVASILPAPDGKTLLVGDRAGQVVEYDAATGAPRTVWRGESWVMGLTPAPLSPPPHAYSMTSSGQVYELESPAEPTGKGASAVAADLNQARGQALAMSPDCRVLVLGDGDGNVRLLDTFVGRDAAAPLHVPGELRRIRFRPGKREFLVLSGGGVRVQELPWPAAIPYSLPQSPVTALGARRAPGSADPNAYQVLAACDRVAALFDATSGAPAGRAVGRESLTAAALHPARDAVLRGWRGGWGEYDFAAKKARPGDSFPDYLKVRSIAVRPGTGEIYVNVGSSVRVSPPGGGPATRTLSLEHLHGGEEARQALFGRGGETLVAAVAARVEFLDPVGGGPRRPSLEAPDEILALALASDAPVLATGHRNRTALVWDLSRDPPAPGPPLNHSQAVTSVALRPDGRVVLTGCRDGTAQAWDVATGLPLGPKRRHRSPVTAVAWGADPGFALAGAADGAATGWPVPTDPAEGTVAELRARYGALTNNTLSD